MCGKLHGNQRLSHPRNYPIARVDIAEAAIQGGFLDTVHGHISSLGPVEAVADMDGAASCA
jgi:hypothetical protein